MKLRSTQVISDRATRDNFEHLEGMMPSVLYIPPFVGAWATGAPGPTSGVAFKVPSRGLLHALFFATAYTTGPAIHIDTYIDGALVGPGTGLNTTLVANSHLALPPAPVQVRLAAGTHYVYFRQTSGSSNADDYGYGMAWFTPGG